MKPTLLLTLPLVLVLGVAAGDAGKSDLDKLQGAWTIVSVQVQGMKETKPEGDTVVFAGNKVTFTIGGEKDVTDFKIDATRKPKWFDIPSGAYKSVGIYELKDDTLRVCLNQTGKDRPTALKSEKDTPNERLFVLRRAK
jgi:uncharacterized protein (TIGR03067 family)